MAQRLPLDDRTAEMVRLACIVASDSDGPVFHAQLDRCHAAGIENRDILAIVQGLAPIVGQDRIRRAAAGIVAVDGSPRRVS